MWILVISVPILAFWVISLPLTALVLLHKNIRKEDNKIKQYLLILYQGLKKDKFYWEFVNSARKIVIFAIFPLSLNLKMLVSILVLIIFSRVQVKLLPYNDPENNDIELSAINAGIITILSGMLYSQEEEVKSINFLLFMICIVLNINFLANWVYLLSEVFIKTSKFAEIVSLF